jgi:Subtilisin inhibitor-like
MPGRRGTPRGYKVIALAAICTAAASACGSTHATGAASGGSGTHSPATARSATQPAVSLVIQVAARPGAVPQRWTLTCDPAGGSHPDAKAACKVLASASNPFAPVPRGIMCPMIVSGPQTATIDGTWHGTPVHATFSKVNGCQTTRWDKIAPVLGTTPAH